MEIMAFDEELSEVAQVLDEVAAHLLLTPPNPNQVPLQQNPTQDPLPHLIYNSQSKPDSDDELEPDLPWREVQDIPSYQLRNAMRNAPQQPIEDNLPFSLQNGTPPPDLNHNNDRDGLWGDWVSYVSPHGPDTQ